jgi:hypothetical protein
MASTVRGAPAFVSDLNSAHWTAVPQLVLELEVLWTSLVTLERVAHVARRFEAPFSSQLPVLGAVHYLLIEPNSSVLFLHTHVQISTE